MSHLPQCPAGSVLRCIFSLVDSDANGIVTLPEFMTFAVRELKLCVVDSDCIRDRFHAVDCDGSGGLDAAEFDEFLADHVCQGVDDEAPDSVAHQEGKLTMEESLKVYIKQQVRAHEKAKAGQQGLAYCPTQVPCDGGGLLDRQRLTLEILSGSIDPDARAILDFWFPGNMTEAMMLWFGKSPTLDEEIRVKFGGMVVKAAKGDLDDWTADPLECLALVILLDQFPRNIFRHQRQMYATDAKAQAVCAKALYNNYHRYLTPLQAIFLPCLVFTHSELFHHQELCVDIWCHLIQNTLPQDDQLRMFGMIFLNHLKVVAKFGRFPHRNEIMGREATKEEEAFLNDKSFRFDLPLRYSSDGRVIFEETDDFVANQQQQQRPSPLQQQSQRSPLQRVFSTSDEAGVKRCLLQRMREWRATLEARLFADADDVIEKKCRKAPVVTERKPETCAADVECPEMRFEGDESSKSAADAATVSAAAAPLTFGREVSRSERQTRKNLMADLLSSGIKEQK